MEVISVSFELFFVVDKIKQKIQSAVSQGHLGYMMWTMTVL